MENIETTCNILQEVGKGLNYFIKNIAAPFLTSWPFVGLIIVWLLKDQLRNLIDRIKGVKGFGASVDMAEQNNTSNPALIPVGVIPSAKKSKSKKKFSLPEYPDNGFKKYFVEVEAFVRKQLSESPYEEIEVLIRDDASFRITTEFEWLYRITFGSQIEFLRQLERKKEILNKDANKFFTAEMTKRNVDTLSYDEWIGFLSAQTLVKIEKKTYKLSDKGLAFLTFIVSKNYDYKPYGL
jgi:hypothetical protein